MNDILLKLFEKYRSVLFLDCIQTYIFSDLIRERWDPLSQHQCRNLGFLLTQLIDECPTLVPSSRPVQKLLQTICLRAQDAIDEDLFVPIYSKQ